MPNPYVKTFLNQVAERFSEDSVNMTNLDWLSRNTTLRNRPFNTKGYEFQDQIINDMHPNLVVIKPSQVGATECQIRKSLAFLLRNPGTSLIFTEPNEDMFTRTSNTRVKPMISKDKVFNTPQDKENRATRSLGLMQFGQSFLYLVPAIESAATSIPADAVFIDELDLSDQQMVALFASRLQNSKHKITQKFSTPTFPSFGVDLDYQSSDQNLYMVRCQHCNHWSHPEFTREFVHLHGPSESLPLVELDRTFQDQIDFSSSYIKCPKCHKPLDLNDKSLRQWVATYPSRVNSRGYRISPFSTGRLDLAYIYKSLWEYQKNEYLRGFYNTVLGVTHSDSNTQLQEADISACMKQPAPVDYGNDPIWVGIDMGQTAHVVIGKHLRDGTTVVLNMYTIAVHELVEHCKTLVNTYNVVGGALDRHPYEPTAREIFQVTKGKILPVEYRGARDTNLVMDQYDNLSHGQANATWFLDQVATRVRKGTLHINGYGLNKRVVIEHFRDMVREETPGEPAKWRKLTGNDHFFHATGFLCVAPHMRELALLESKADMRTMALGIGVNVGDTPNLAGISNKRLESPLLGG